MTVRDPKRRAILAEIGASIGPISFVVYPAIQIHGNNEQLRAQAYNDKLDKLDRPLAPGAATPAERFVRGSLWTDLRRHCTIGLGASVVWSFGEF
jgi:hypothetical protein